MIYLILNRFAVANKGIAFGHNGHSEIKGEINP